MSWFMTVGVPVLAAVVGVVGTLWATKHINRGQRFEAETAAKAQKAAQLALARSSMAKLAAEVRPTLGHSAGRALMNDAEKIEALHQSLKECVFTCGDELLLDIFSEIAIYTAHVKRLVPQVNPQLGPNTFTHNRIANNELVAAQKRMASALDRLPA